MKLEVSVASENLEINLFLGHLHSLEYFFFYSLEYFKTNYGGGILRRW